MVLKHEDFVKNGVLDNFAFIPAELEAMIRSDLQLVAYDKRDPSTWPLITLATLNKHRGDEYAGRQGLPAYVAYEPIIMARYRLKHFGERTRTGTTLHNCYPCNFDQQNVLKKEVGMTTAEESNFRRNMRGDASFYGKTDTPNRPKTQAPTSAPRAQRATPCQNPSCAEGKKQNAAFRELLSKKETEHKKEAQELTARLAKWKRSFEISEAESEDARNRAMKAENKHRDLVRELDTQRRYCAELKAENWRLKGGSGVYRPATVEDIDSDEETVMGMD
ncbi:hypothetical protein CC86DRAFT_161741 [Ophiobolus disseminans]|uniref:Uncharacterized protein n=1 Tax=Ophiobolus disseminans TaxID=1469910 RepID=A0A6A7AB49_9PLEO|nr:hypothetical protein CC86DRAFT_161741 [Ophiobolus disseminans]